MTVAVYLPLVLPLLVALAARFATDRARPGAAVPALVGSAPGVVVSRHGALLRYSVARTVPANRGVRGVASR